ncbi:MAG: formylglycine-generating enzyme family protein [Phycisphaerales bacterium]
MKTNAVMSVYRVMVISVAVIMLSVRAEGQTLTGHAQSKSVLIPGTTVSFDLVRVPGGVVEVDGTAHEVPDLWVLPHEVTWDLYDIFLYELDKPESERESVGKGADAVTRPSKPYVPPDRGLGHEGYPAMGMTLHAARSFCDWLREHTGIESRLPTKAEWVHLASAKAGEVWSKENADYTTHPVMSQEPNEFGLHDTLGNVAEWVETDEKRPFAMGGSYKQPASECTPLSLQKQTSSWNASDPQIPKSKWWLADCSWVGFRFVVEVSEEEGETDDE